MKIDVSGRPMPRGSMRAFLHRETGRPIITDTRRKHLRQWMALVEGEARAAGATLLHDPISMLIDFRMPIPKRGVKDAFFHNKRPDLDKLIRAILDALTGVCYEDDSQVVILYTRKHYAPHPGVTIIVNPVSRWELQ